MDLIPGRQPTCSELHGSGLILRPRNTAKWVVSEIVEGILLSQFADMPNVTVTKLSGVFPLSPSMIRGYKIRLQRLFHDFLLRLSF